MKPKEFEITLKVRVEAENLSVAEVLATAIVNDLSECGKEYVDRPINTVRWQRISPVFDNAVDVEADAAVVALNDALGAVNVAMDESDAIAYRDQPNDVDLVDICPGCVDCGPPVVVKAEDACGRGKAQTGEVAAASMDSD